MEPLEHRSLTGQLAEDLRWLEEHCRDQPELAAHAGQLRLAAALVRNCIAPFLEGQQAVPLHLVVVGGAGAGKSTVVNFLTGSPAAEANPQAGFTRHPVAYAGGNGSVNLPATVGFLGPLQKLPKPGPSSLDEDVYQVRRIPGSPSTNGDPVPPHPLADFIIWDCPDMTTWAAQGYVPRLLEVAGLADVLVYVASDERYNDEVPTQFLELLLKAGKPVVVCLTKMQPAQAEPLLKHFQGEVLSRLNVGRNAIESARHASLAIPFLTTEELSDPAAKAGRFRIPLLNQVGVLGDPPAVARERTVRNATGFLKNTQDGLLHVARQDLEAMENWRSAVQAGQVEFNTRYRREYLTSEKFHRFDEALLKMLDLLELPGVGRVLSGALSVARAPYKMLRGLVTKALARPETVSLPELPVLEGAFTGWLDSLRAEALRRAGSHPLWKHVANGFELGLMDQAHDRFSQGFRSFQLGLADEVERTSRAIYADLEKNPAVLNGLRGSKFLLDAAGVTGVLLAGGLNYYDLVLVPLSASVTHQLVEWMGKGYVDRQREQTRLRQELLVSQYISAPLAEWLGQWPATGGSAYEMLTRVLRRVPAAVRQVDEAVTKRIATQAGEVRGPA
jgi:GTP-binding protein EngB required for normal cell division